MSEKLYQITAGHFCAGIAISDRGLVIAAAPIVAYMVGWTERRVANYVQQKAWRIVALVGMVGDGEQLVNSNRHPLDLKEVEELGNDV